MQPPEPIRAIVALFACFWQVLEEASLTTAQRQSLVELLKEQLEEWHYNKPLLMAAAEDLRRYAVLLQDAIVDGDWDSTTGIIKTAWLPAFERFDQAQRQLHNVEHVLLHATCRHCPRNTSEQERAACGLMQLFDEPENKGACLLQAFGLEPRA